MSALWLVPLSDCLSDCPRQGARSQSYTKGKSTRRTSSHRPSIGHAARGTKCTARPIHWSHRPSMSHVRCRVCVIINRGQYRGQLGSRSDSRGRPCTESTLQRGQLQQEHRPRDHQVQGEDSEEPMGEPYAPCPLCLRHRCEYTAIRGSASHHRAILHVWALLLINSETGHSEDQLPNLRYALGSVKRVKVRATGDLRAHPLHVSSYKQSL